MTNEIFYSKNLILDNKKKINLFKNYLQIINSTSIKNDYWLDAGTLLGIIRDKKIIEWDYDFDFAIKYKKKNKNLLHELNARNLSSYLISIGYQTTKKNLSLNKFVLEILKIITDLKYDYFIDGSLLLSLIREKKIGRWVNNIPVTILNGDINNLFTIIKEIFSDSYKLYNSSKKADCICINIENIPVFLYFATDHKSAFQWRVGHKIHKFNKQYLSIQKITFDNYQICIPKNYNKYLSKRYGKWKNSLYDWPSISNNKYIPIKICSEIEGCVFDIFFYFNLNQKELVMFVPIAHTIKKNHVKNLKVETVYNERTNIPSESNKYLEHRYGKNWRIPIKNWVPSRDDNNKVNFKKSFKNISSRY